MFLQHMWGVIYHPKEEWPMIREEHYSTTRCYTSHIIYLAAIPPLSLFIGTTQIGWSVAGGEFMRLTVSSALPLAIAFYVAMLVGVAIMAYATHWMEKTYGSESSMDDCMVLTAFTATPMFLSGLVGLVPILWLDVFVGLAGVAYATYLLFTGVPVIMNIPKDRGFFFSASILTVGLVVLVGILATSAMLWGSFLVPAYH